MVGVIDRIRYSQGEVAAVSGRDIDHAMADIGGISTASSTPAEVKGNMDVVVISVYPDILYGYIIGCVLACVYRLVGYRGAEDEIARYRLLSPEFTASVSIREDLYSGLLVSRGRLLVGRRTKIPAARVDALLQHEVGTHLVTYYNGRAQPFRQLDSGLAGYDGLQEGLAVLSEYLVGGLSRPRMRLLAARVIAVEQLVQGPPSSIRSASWIGPTGSPGGRHIRLPCGSTAAAA